MIKAAVMYCSSY